MLIVAFAVYIALSLGSPALPVSFWVSACEACQRLVAVVNVVSASSGIGAALLPVRRADFLGRLATSSASEGNSGDEEIKMRESSSDILARADRSRPPETARGRLRGGERMRHARPNRTERPVESDTINFGYRFVGKMWGRMAEMLLSKTGWHSFASEASTKAPAGREWGTGCYDKPDTLHRDRAAKSAELAHDLNCPATDRRWSVRTAHSFPLNSQLTKFPVDQILFTIAAELRHLQQPNPLSTTFQTSKWRTTVARSSICKFLSRPSSPQGEALTVKPPATSPASALRRAESSRPRTTAPARFRSPRSTRTAAPSRARTSSTPCRVSCGLWARATMR